MPIKKQKIFVFIPLLNIVPLILWIKACRNESIPMSFFMKELVKVFLAIFIVPLLRFGIITLNPEIGEHGIAFAIQIYLCLTFVSFFSVKAQLKIMNKRHNEGDRERFSSSK